MKPDLSGKSMGMIDLALECESRNIEFPVSLSRLAVWERYIPFTNEIGFYQDIIQDNNYEIKTKKVESIFDSWGWF